VFVVGGVVTERATRAVVTGEGGAAVDERRWAQRQLASGG
jgi:hypothetical protein